ncbi:hypothetical protein [Magnetospirillum fulvum]|uniref:PilZ domain-containing protein n=1 Tax=Magnetospirillum fulvum MGU-K5 TaxID=1316936 RepID=S9SFQ1_MAGFU|nr:hypothetical protein [Magnetospirillum fulvum]EPY03564.1 hypothetical protein K678_00595 [Magnetospirillum fulvum MGU-K5]
MAIRGLNRRLDDRHRGDGLFLLFDGNLVEVIDVSIGGLKFRNPPFRLDPGFRFPFELRSADEDPNPLAKGIAIVRAAQEDWVAVEFVRPTFTLLKVVGRHIGRQLLGHNHLFRL